MSLRSKIPQKPRYHGMNMYYGHIPNMYFTLDLCVFLEDRLLGSGQHSCQKNIFRLVRRSPPALWEDGLNFVGRQYPRWWLCLKTTKKTLHKTGVVGCEPAAVCHHMYACVNGSCQASLGSAAAQIAWWFEPLTRTRTQMHVHTQNKKMVFFLFAWHLSQPFQW